MQPYTLYISLRVHGLKCYLHISVLHHTLFIIVLFTAVAGSLRQLEEDPEWEEGRLESGEMGRAGLHRELVLAEGRAGGSQQGVGHSQ